jgi:hypothetical protein
MEDQEKPTPKTGIGVEDPEAAVVDRSQPVPLVATAQEQPPHHLPFVHSAMQDFASSADASAAAHGVAVDVATAQSRRKAAIASALDTNNDSWLDTGQQAARGLVEPSIAPRDSTPVIHPQGIPSSSQVGQPTLDQVGNPVGIASTSEVGQPTAQLEGTASVLADADVVNATITVRFSPETLAQLQDVADGFRSAIPWLRQLVEAQSKAGGNTAASIVRLNPDAPRVAELTATILSEELRADNPRTHVVEQCLRVANMLLETALKVLAGVIIGIDTTLAYNALADPEQAHRHAQNIATAIGQLLPLFVP